jgi:hypothetical protein
MRQHFEADPERIVFEIVRRVSKGHDESLMIRSSAHGHPWIQVSRVSGESALLCEGVSNEYLSRFRQLEPGAGAQLQALGWHERLDAPFARWVDADTTEQRAQLASELFRTLVEVYGHDGTRPPLVQYP